MLMTHGLRYGSQDANDRHCIWHTLRHADLSSEAMKAWYWMGRSCLVSGCMSKTCSAP